VFPLEEQKEILSEIDLEIRKVRDKRN